MAEVFDEITAQQLDAILTQSEFEEISRIGQPVQFVQQDPQIQSLAESRFNGIQMGEDEIAQFIAAQQNENTKRKTDSDMRLFKAFCVSRGENRPIESLQPLELDTLFGNFLISIKKQKGDEYEPSSIRGFLSSLDRYLKTNRYPHTVVKNSLFPHTNEALQAKMKSLKAQGYGNKPNESDELTDSDIEKLFECGQLGTETPMQLTNLLHTSFSLVLGMRGGVEPRNLKWGDIELNTDEDGDEYLCHKRERQTKTRVGADPKDTRKFKPKVWNNADLSRCPVQAYKIFSHHRPKEMQSPDAPFFLAINHQRNPNNPRHCWFKNCPLGKNQMYKLVPNMKANCPALNDGRRLTYHSVRKHLLQKCNDMGLAPTDTVQISGHKNLQSVNSYAKLNNQQQKKIATALINTDSNTEAQSCDTVQISGHKNLQGVNSYAKLNNEQQKKMSMALVNTDSNTGVALNKCYSPVLAAAPPVPVNQLDDSPINPSQTISFKRQSAQSNMSSIFQGTTTISGGVFNFYGSERFSSPTQSLSPPKRKFRRIRCIDSDSE